MDTSDAHMFCKDCGHDRPLSDFYRVKDKRAAGGYRYGPYCKAHTKVRNAEARRNAPEGSRLRESMRRASAKWDAAHPENRRERVARHLAKKKDDAGEAS
jgi:hypothetical protein